MCKSGDVVHYDPNGWDHGAGYRGLATDSLSDPATLLGLMAEHLDGLLAAEADRRHTAAAALRAVMTEQVLRDGETSFWDPAFE
ncbi:hypothetical protein ACIRPT_19415 [Streptomyces sp. NPDC101227]|uniref:hypothetical protein n=1 Tax=Streptomyces sp. NPDC101227 TaxID=3366136 RepID=UPI00382B399B